MRKILSLFLGLSLLLCSCTVQQSSSSGEQTATLAEPDFSDVNKYTVDCFGDGFTSGVGTSYTHWLGRLLDYSWKVNNYGSKDDTVLGVCARQGCIPAVIKPVTIANENSYTYCEIVSSYKRRPLNKMLIYSAKSFNPVTIGGDLFSISNETIDSETSQFSIRPITAVSQPTVISEDTELISSYAMNNDYKSIMVVMIGSDESYESLEELVEFNKKMIEGYERYIVISEPYQIKGNDRADYDALMLKEFGRNYLNAREYIIRNGMSDLGLEPTEKDIERINNGYTPTSLMSGKYYNDYGNQLLADCVYKKGCELGYWS